MTFFIFLLACAAAASTGVIFKPGAWVRIPRQTQLHPTQLAVPGGLDDHLPAAGLGRLSLEPDPRQPNGAGAVGCANCPEYPVDAGIFSARIASWPGW